MNKLLHTHRVQTKSENCWQKCSCDFHQLFEGCKEKIEDWLYLRRVMNMLRRLTKVKQIQFSQWAFMVGYEGYENPSLRRRTGITS